MPATGLKRGELRIRMYRVGFGDCFLLSVPVSTGHRHVLVDCGVHSAGRVDTLERAIEDVEKETGGSLAVIVASHEHQDHISGFGRFPEAFARFRVGEVWLPWSSDPQDPQAARLGQKRLAIAEALVGHFAARGASAEAKAVIHNLRGNEKALHVLRSGMGGDPRVRYLEAGQELVSPADVAGLSVRVLGPPRDPDFLKKMDPPESQRFFRAGPRGQEGPVNAVLPFGAPWTVPPREARASVGFSRKDEARLRTAVLTDLEGLAFALDRVVNNTSLVLLFNYRGRGLLFPGDAQWGSWKAWLDRDGSRELLRQVSFYKVGHHGSHNATPRGAIEGMPEGGFAAMVSTQSEPWPSIPQSRLMEALARRSQGRTVRSDSIRLSGAPSGPLLPKLPRGFSRGEFWLDYRIRISLQ